MHNETYNRECPKSSQVQERIVQVRRTKRTLKAYAKNALLRGLSAARKFEPAESKRRRLRKELVSRYLGPNRKLADSWIGQQTETENFYYELTPKNRSDLASLVGVVVGLPFEHVDAYLSELRSDEELEDLILSSWALDSTRADATVGFGRREGWYAFIRAMKPKVVVETGVHDGVGACVILAALRENASEGFPGQYFGTDIRPNAGWLIPTHFKSNASVLIGDSLDTLSAFDHQIDIFINDSDHSAEYEAREYEMIRSKLTPNSLILGDNSHNTESLRQFSRKNSRPYLFFREEPMKHWYPGGGIGISPASIPH